MSIMVSALVNSFRKIMNAGNARDDLPFILSTSSTVIVVVFFACVGASIGNSALLAFPVLSFVFTVPSLAVFVVCIVAALLSMVSRRRCCNSALRPLTESLCNCRAFLSSATLIKYWNCSAACKGVKRINA